MDATGRTRLQQSSNNYASRIKAIDIQIGGHQDQIVKLEAEKAEHVAAKKILDDQIDKLPAPKPEKSAKPAAR